MIEFITKKIGDRGEKYAAGYLKKQHYKILIKNYRKPCGEIDIIAQKGDVVAFVEVKTRHTNPMTQPYEAVDRKKQLKLARTAALFAAQFGMKAYYRFDTCEVFVDRNTLKLNKINYYENAFYSPIRF